MSGKLRQFCAHLMICLVFLRCKRWVYMIYQTQYCLYRCRDRVYIKRTTDQGRALTGYLPLDNSPDTYRLHTSDLR